MSNEQNAVADANELGLTRAGRKISIMAWGLSAFVVIVGVVALIATDKKIFILFIVLGILTPLNVLFYDMFVLKPKVARLKAERAAAESAASEEKETGK